MADFVAANDIQENVSILLEDYPFLKVFSKPEGFDIFSESNFKILEQLGGRMLFRINLEAGPEKTVSVTPYVETGSVADVISIYNPNKTMIEGYIKYQLVNSGILDALSDIPITTGIKQEQYERVEKNGKFVNWGDSPEFNSCICVRLNPGKKSNTSTSYHNDSTLFQILQYSKSNSTYVLGSELLFYHENDLTVTHRGIEKTAKGLTVFPEEKFGTLIHDRYELAKNMYGEIKIKNPEAPHLRFKLNNGDTMVFPDTLWKHAVINPKENEKRDGNILHIDLANALRNYEANSVKVCSERLVTDQSHYDGRSIIGMFCFINDIRFMKPENFLATFPLTGIEPKPMPIINLTKEGCKEFLTPFSDGTGCTTINGINIKSRGGKNRKKRAKRTKKTRKSRRRKTIKNPN
jgi:hypothetical protein